MMSSLCVCEREKILFSLLGQILLVIFQNTYVKLVARYGSEPRFAVLRQRALSSNGINLPSFHILSNLTYLIAHLPRSA